MKFLHSRFHLNSRENVRVTLDSQANVLLMDDTNFSLYKRGDSHRYYGGLATQSPVTLSAPCVGFWNVVVDLGGYAGSVRASVRKI
jgi:hypothetical protein